MKRQHLTTLVIAAILCGCAAKTYDGKGGMAAYSIKPEVYAYHYEHGFTGPDAMGWDPNLQYIWSRMGTAKTCGVPVNQAVVVKKLITSFGQDELVHNRIGIDFHNGQSRASRQFCTPERVAEAAALMPRLEAGEFVKRF